MIPACAKATANKGGLAQLARAPALQAGGHRFDSDILHGKRGRGIGNRNRSHVETQNIASLHNAGDRPEG